MPTREILRQKLLDTPLFAEKIWKLSPEPWALTEAQLRDLKRIGAACLSYHRALERLYVRSFSGKKILRNREVYAPWVAEYLDRYKPAGLVAHGRHRAVKHQCPVVLRPDLLITEQGFTMTELDSVPGGVGLTAYLNEVYAEDYPGVIGRTSMPDRFMSALGRLTPKEKFPLVAIVVSEEGATYRPEFEWLGEKLRSLGHDVHVVEPSQVMQMGDGSYVPVDGAPRRVDILYRFFELFDLANVENADAMLRMAESGELSFTPPLKAFLEEKLWLALFWSPTLEDYWHQQLSTEHWALLRRCIPHGWVVDPAPLPPFAVFPKLDIQSWNEMKTFGGKKRELVLKISGFSERGWGSRGVFIGHDLSQEQWGAAIDEALASFPNNPFVLQEFHRAKVLPHPAWVEETQTTRVMPSRVRLCPYYFGAAEVDEPVLGGVLATVCPSDKKILHGMRDAMMLPCIAR
jgi:hypothetical protein